MMQMDPLAILCFMLGASIILVVVVPSAVVVVYNLVFVLTFSNDLFSIRHIRGTCFHFGSHQDELCTLRGRLCTPSTFSSTYSGPQHEKIHALAHDESHKGLN